jgi:hypothetical protein
MKNWYLIDTTFLGLNKQKFHSHTIQPHYKYRNYVPEINNSGKTGIPDYVPEKNLVQVPAGKMVTHRNSGGIPTEN